MHSYSFPPDVTDLAAELLAAARRRRLRLTTAESCTGGLIGAVLTDIAGSSEVVEGGFIVYANRTKAELLGVPDSLLEEHGAVSAPVASAMADGALERTHAHVAVSVTGVAGPGGGTETKPVGLVHFATALRGGATIGREERFGDIGRAEVRTEAVRVALHMLLARVLEVQPPDAGGEP